MEGREGFWRRYMGGKGLSAYNVLETYPEHFKSRKQRLLRDTFWGLKGELIQKANLA